ncbi:MAG: o-succinylbenzoate synthase [Victivallaceae bacterium]|nr:o-succinylbenzoate synthase [Victivallaceae bacterium]
MDGDKMKIDGIEIYWVGMPLIYPFRTAFGNDETIESVLVKIVSGELYGWGEGASWKYPAYSGECAAGQFLISTDFIAPLLMGREINSGTELQDILSGIRGNYFAKAEFDLAWWDIYAKSQDQPLWKVLGGKSPTLESGADFGVMETYDALLGEIEKAVKAGTKRVKFKYRPGWDLEMVDVVRKTFPDIVMHIDCNSAYTIRDLAMFKKLDKYNLAMIEQPLGHDDLISHAALQAKIATPVCLDESITTPEKAAKAIKIKACRWVNIKLGRTGGLTNAVEINRICADGGVPCWVGSMVESAIGMSHNLAFATSSANLKYPADIFPTDRFYVRDIGYPEMKFSEPSKFTANASKGIGTEPVPEFLERCTIKKASFES